MPRSRGRERWTSRVLGKADLKAKEGSCWGGAENQNPDSKCVTNAHTSIKEKVFQPSAAETLGRIKGHIWEE